MVAAALFFWMFLRPLLLLPARFLSPPTLIRHAEAPRLPFLVVGGCERHGLCLQRRLRRREKGENLRMAFHRNKAEPEPPSVLIPVSRKRLTGHKGASISGPLAGFGGVAVIAESKTGISWAFVGVQSWALENYPNYFGKGW